MTAVAFFDILGFGLGLEGHGLGLCGCALLTPLYLRAAVFND